MAPTPLNASIVHMENMLSLLVPSTACHVIPVTTLTETAPFSVLNALRAPTPPTKGSHRVCSVALVSLRSPTVRLSAPPALPALLPTQVVVLHALVVEPESTPFNRSPTCLVPQFAPTVSPATTLTKQDKLLAQLFPPETSTTFPDCRRTPPVVPATTKTKLDKPFARPAQLELTQTIMDARNACTALQVHSIHSLRRHTAKHVLQVLTNHKYLLRVFSPLIALPALQAPTSTRLAKQLARVVLLGHSWRTTATLCVNCAALEQSPQSHLNW